MLRNAFNPGCSCRYSEEKKLSMPLITEARNTKFTKRLCRVTCTIMTTVVGFARDIPLDLVQGISEKMNDIHRY